MCNECAYCGTVTAPLRVDGDQLTCRDCCADDDLFFAMTTLEEWSADRREEQYERGEWLRDQRIDRAMAQVGSIYRGGNAVAAGLAAGRC